MQELGLGDMQPWRWELSEIVTLTLKCNFKFVIIEKKGEKRTQDVISVSGIR